MPIGRPTEVRLYFNSADASTAAYVSIYSIDGVLLANTKYGAGAGTEFPYDQGRLIITDLHVVVGADITAQLFADANDDGAVDAGEELARWGQGSFNAHFIATGLSCRAGAPPKIIGSGAGAITLIGTGYIIRT